MRHLILTTFLLAAHVTADESKANPAADRAAFEKAAAGAAWAEVFSDSCTEDWEAKWFLDGKVGTVTNSPEGMAPTAGPEFRNDAHHMVLWTKDSFAGDLKIEYDYTRLDEVPNCVTILVSSANNQIVSRCKLNFSPTNVGMEPVYWNGPDHAALLYNGGWLWDLKTNEGRELPDLPPPNGGDVHRMAFHHAIPANLCGDAREELVLWDPTATEFYIYTPAPLNESDYRRYAPTARQYNPRLMD